MEVLLCFRVVGLLVVPFSTAENQPQRVFTPPSSPHRIDNDNDTPPHQAGGAEEDAGDAVCRVWLAPSTIPGAGLGMFAGTAFGEWEPIGTPDIVIPVVDYYHHNPGEQHDFIFDFYGWNVWRYGTIRYDTIRYERTNTAAARVLCPRSSRSLELPTTRTHPAMLSFCSSSLLLPCFFRSQSSITSTNSHTSSFPNVESEGIESIAFCPGPGAALNCMMALVNTVGADDHVKTDQAGLHRSQDPGAGAFTPFYNRQLLSRGSIQPGDELFDSYGEAYFLERDHLFGKIPLKEEDHEQADELLAAYVDLKSHLCPPPVVVASTTGGSSSVSAPAPCGLHADWYSLLTSISSLWPSRILNALPQDPDRVDEIARKGTVHVHSDRSRKPVSWLRTHGSCMDWLEIRKSRIAQAGRGAFARTALQAGQVVGPSPLLHVPRHILNMYPLAYTRHGRSYVNATGNAPNHHQLVLNYCWGHRHSSILLCPYGAATSLINHGSGQQANVKLQWNKQLIQHPEWLNATLAEWSNDMHAGLMWDFVAIRDIAKGEEILIDYGPEWDHAWKTHVQNWRPPPNAHAYRGAPELNEMVQVLRTGSEGRHLQYDESNVQLQCRHLYLEWDGLIERDNDDDDDADDDDEEENNVQDREKSLMESISPCRVVSRTEGVDGEEHYYTAEVYREVLLARESQTVVEHVLFRVPRDAFVFTDRPYTREYVVVLPLF